MRHYGEGARPAVIVSTHADGSLGGLLPLVLTPGRPRSLRFAGANLGDHFHPVAPLGEDAEVAAAASPALRAAPRSWRSLVLDNIDVEAAWWPRIREEAQLPLAATAYRQAILPLIEFGEGGWEGYLATRSRNLRSQIGRKTRALERNHELAFRRTVERSGVAADVSAFFRLHDERWSGRGGSASSTERSRSFHADFAAAALERGWLRLWFLELDGEAVAAWYGWRLGPRYSYYLAGFSPLWSRKSVGFVLLAHTMRSAVEEGAREYDLLLGAEEYKSRFATTHRHVQTVVVTPRLGATRLLAQGEATAWRIGQRLPPAARQRARVAYRTVAERLPVARRR